MGMLTMEVIVAYRDGRVESVSPHTVLSKLRRENGYIVVEYTDFFNPETMFEYPGLIDVDMEKRKFIYTFKRYRGTDKPRFYPKCTVVERGVNYVVVQRHDGVLFKINHAFPAEILLNVVNNPGIALWDLISLEVLVFSKEYPDITEEELLDVMEATVEVLGYYVYILDLVKPEF